jgi:hypothetical protein
MKNNTMGYHGINNASQYVTNIIGEFSGVMQGISRKKKTNKYELVPKPGWFCTKQ